MSFVHGPRWWQICKIVACTWALSSCGGSGGATGSGGGTDPARAYVANAGTLSTYSINPSSGALTGPVGSPLALPSNSTLGGIGQIATDPSGQFLYLLDPSGVYAYAIDQNTGAMTAVAGSPFQAQSIPTSLAIDASGRYLYVAGRSGPVAPVTSVISAYSVNGSGALTPIANYSVSSELSTVVAAGNYLYVAGFYTNSITAFSIGSTGELSENVPGSPFVTDIGPYFIVADPSGSVLYTANIAAPTATEPTPGSISAFTIDSSTGELIALFPNPQPIAAQGAISIDPMGKFLFVPEMSGVSVYAINTNSAALSAVAGSPFSAGADPNVVSVDPTDRFVYVVNNGSANISEFALESTGALTPLAGSPVSIGNTPGDIAIVGH